MKTAEQIAMFLQPSSCSAFCNFSFDDARLNGLFQSMPMSWRSEIGECEGIAKLQMKHLPASIYILWPN